MVKSAAASMYSASVDPTVSTLGTFILAMLTNPEAQRKAQCEIDAVVGRDRLPQFEDMEALPYVSALLKEVLRWRNVTPIGSSLRLHLLHATYFCFSPSIAIPHCVSVEDEYRGYRIPAGSVVIGNVWLMHSNFYELHCLIFVIRAICHDEVIHSHLRGAHTPLNSTAIRSHTPTLTRSSPSDFSSTVTRRLRTPMPCSDSVEGGFTSRVYAHSG
jgi:hypothetical protein